MSTHDDADLAARRKQLELSRLEFEEEELRVKRAKLQKEKQSQAETSRSSIVELNVGGQIFATSRETLLQSGSSYFERILEIESDGIEPFGQNTNHLFHNRWIKRLRSSGCCYCPAWWQRPFRSASSTWFGGSTSMLLVLFKQSYLVTRLG